MIIRCLQTTGDGVFKEVEYDKPEPVDNEIEVRAIMTGVCRSDIDMMDGNFGPLPLHMQGHEGLGQVTKLGSNISGISIGDYVATRGEPAYADFYNVRVNEFVKVPKAHPRYIIEPVACGVNIIEQAANLIAKKDPTNTRVLILGSGFLAYIAYYTLRNKGYTFPIDIVGSHNKEMWEGILKSDPIGQYDIVIDLSNRTDIFDKDILNNEALIIFGTQKTVTTDFSNILWKACTMVFPSPRTKYFHGSMVKAVDLVEHIPIDKFWTKCYNRTTEWQQAFADGLARPSGYSRGYLQWD